MKKWQIGAWLLLIVGLSCWRYVPGLTRPSDPFDERTTLTGLAQAQSAMEECFPRQWCYLRPLGNLTYWTDRVIWGVPNAHYLPNGELDKKDILWQISQPEIVFGYRLTNLILHILASLAFGLMIWRITKQKGIGLLGSVLWVFNPQAFYVTGWIAARYDALCAPFFFLTVFYAFGTIMGKRFQQTALMIVCFVLALASKEHAVILPVLIPVLVLITRPIKEWKAWLLPVAVLWVILGIYLAIRLELVGYMLNAETVAAAQKPRFFGLFERFMLGPAPQLLHQLPILFNSVWALLSSSFWLAILGQIAFWASVVLLIKRQWRLALAFWVWMAVVYVPIAHIYAFNLFPHYLFLPSAGIVGLVALTVWQWKEIGERLKPFPALLLCLGVSFFLVSYAMGPH